MTLLGQLGWVQALQIQLFCDLPGNMQLKKSILLSNSIALEKCGPMLKEIDQDFRLRSPKQTRLVAILSLQERTFVNNKTGLSLYHKPAKVMTKKAM